ncbi:hypothetical protein HKX48_007083 [Thoreauomyces humboldtii]|nr:hypothetical protein HKX48_007083 [Thoreauomyces humboldtii]
MNSYIGPHIAPAGWKIWSATSPNTDGVTFAEYSNVGPGAWNSARATFATLLTDSSQVANYTLSAIFPSATWIDLSYSGTLPNPPLVPRPSVPATEYIVGSTADSDFPTIQSAINGAPQDGTNVTIYVHPGVYNEQVFVNRSYTTIKPVPNVAGKVTVQYNYGRPTADSLDNTTSVLTIVKKTTNVNIYDMTFQNTYLQQKSVVGLALNVNGLKVGFYGVSFIGFQDTVLINKPSTSFFKDCYIEGSVDFIWGTRLARHPSRGLA